MVKKQVIWFNNPLEFENRAYDDIRDKYKKKLKKKQESFAHDEFHFRDR
jgi:hypothetical protein